MMESSATKKVSIQGRRNKGRLRIIVPFMLYLVSGIGVIIWTGSLAKSYAVSSSWKDVKGTLTSLRVESISERRTKLNGQLCALNYTYSVDRKVYTGDRVSAFSVRGKEHVCRNLKSKLNKANMLTVFYNPQNHSESLQTIYFSQPMLTMLGALSYVYIGIGFQGVYDGFARREPFAHISAASWFVSSSSSALAAGVQLGVGGNLLIRKYYSALISVIVGIIFAFLSMYSMYRCVRVCLGKDDEFDFDEAIEQSAM